MRMGMLWLWASHLQVSSTNMHDPGYQDLSPLTWETDAKLSGWAKGCGAESSPGVRGHIGGSRAKREGLGQDPSQR